MTKGITQKLRLHAQAIGELLQQSAADQAAQAAAGSLEEADKEHDVMVRTLLTVLEALKHLSGAPSSSDQGRVQRLTKVRKTLFPDGASQVKKSYLVEAAEAPIHVANLTPDEVKMLKGIPFDGGSVYDLVQAYVKAAEHLGSLLALRDGSQAAAGAAAPLTEGRRELMQSIQGLMTLMPFSELPAERQAAIRGIYQGAIEAQERRNQARASGSAEASSESVESTDEAALHADPADLSQGT